MPQESVETALARIDALLHESVSQLAPGVDDEGEVDYESEPASTMALNTWGLVALFTDMESGDNFVRTFFPAQLPTPFLRGLLMEAADSF